ncbi:hypothetical protein AB0K60_04520 [Thermopolyspora sp. NPDC052614]|uniref:hypothetical protein n=1 Tax=Thermopolyspora sp. NPDC052614 TaxID=3155682 RepID=UPI0034310DE1
MSDPQIDPAGNTQQFKAFAQRQQQQEEVAEGRPGYLIPAIVIGVLVVAAVVVYLIVR